MSQSDTNTANQPQSKQPEAAEKPCDGGAPVATPASKKKKLSLDIEEIGEVLERKISP